MLLEMIHKATGRTAAELTRRGVARAMLTVPAAQALAQLPAVRQELAAAGNPLSLAFWDSAEATLSSIQAGDATVGEVRQWLEATGSEPTHLVPSELFLWPDEDERGPIAADLHAWLVAHLESLVAAGTIDPDRLVAGDEAALASYQQIQLDWLRTPLPDGRVPMQAVADEEDDELLAAWDEAEADALEALDELLAELPPRPCPDGELHAVCDRLRRLLTADDPLYQLLRAAAGVDASRLPSDDRELWLTLAAGVVAQQESPPEGALDDDSMAAWAMLEPLDWTAAVVSLVRRGPGTLADADALAEETATFDFGDDEFDDDEPDDDEPDDDELDDDEPDGAWFDEDEAGVQYLTAGLGTVLRLWQLLGGIDETDRLTDLGWWGLPESLRHAWRPAEAA